MSDRVYGAEEKAKLERLVKEGVTVLQEIEDLLINKAIKVAQKRDWSRVADEFEDLETLVATTGYDKDA